MKNPNFASVRFTAVVAAIITLALAMAVVPSLAQNAVPPTARQAAASPAYASKLHPATAPAASKRRASPRAPARRGACGASPQDNVIYDNGPVNGTVDAWTINFGYSVSDSFTANGRAVTGFDFYVWAYPGDTPLTVDWSITSQPLGGGTVYGSGTASVTSTFIFSNQYGYDIDKLSVTGLNVALGSGTSWLNLQNATTSFGDPLFWDENSGPSQAYESAVGSIASEAFDVTGSGYPLPPCFQSGGNMQILHDFRGQGDGSHPSGVAADAAGNVYGAMSTSDTGYGLVYEIAAKDQSWVFNPLYNFTGGSDGAYPSMPIVGREGALYGTAAGGDFGLLYRLRPAPTACLTALCSWAENVLYHFADGPSAGSIAAFDQAGNLYGMSASGGAYGQGAVFELTPSLGGWTEEILYSFTGGSDGGGPNSLLVGHDGNLYGTAGGGAGVVFQLVRPPSGDTWTENVIYSFTGGSDGYGPYSLVQDGLGSLLGLASGRTSNGTLFVQAFLLSPSNGGWVFSVVGGVYGNKGWSTSNLASDAQGNVYWAFGYQEGCEGYVPTDVVSMRPPGGNFSTLWYSGNYTFYPTGALAVDGKGNVYGTTSGCGKYGQGAVWRVTP